MSEYIKREDAIKAALSVPPYMGAIEAAIKDVPAADVRPVVLCHDCKFWRDAYVKQNDGIERQYRDDETDELGLLPHCVSNDVGINVGAKCRIEDNCGWNCDKSVFRNADDYCSRGEKRPCSYEEWWGIVDGIYPKQYSADMRNQEGDTP